MNTRDEIRRDNLINLRESAFYKRRYRDNLWDAIVGVGLIVATLAGVTALIVIWH